MTPGRSGAGIDAAARIYRLASIVKRARGFKRGLIGPERLQVSLVSLGWWDDRAEKTITTVDRAAAELKVLPFEVTLDRTMSFSNRPDNHAFVLVGSGGVDRLRAFHALQHAKTPVATGRAAPPSNWLSTSRMVTSETMATARPIKAQV